MKKNLIVTAASAGSLVLASFALALPASASQVNCDAKASQYEGVVSAVYTESPQRRCTVVTEAIGDAVPSGSVTWSEPETRVLDEYDSEPETVRGELLSSSAGEPVYGEWQKVGEEQVTTTTAPTGKSKNTKTVTTTVSTYEREVSTTVTYVYEMFSVTYSLQDVETYREGSEATTVTKTVTTRVFNVNQHGTVTGSGSPSSTDTTESGEPQTHEETVAVEEGVVVTDEDGQPVETSREEQEPTEENGGITSETTTETETYQETATETCVANKNKSKNRGNCE